MRAALTACLVVASVLVAPAAAASEIPVPSIELMTAHADVVALGEVVGWSPPPPTSDVRPAGTRRLTVRVEHRLKGQVAATFEATGVSPPLAPGTRVMVFARMEQVSSSCGPDPATGRVHTSGELRFTHLVAGPPEAWVLAARDFRLVRDWVALTATVRAQAARVDWGGAVHLPIPPASPVGAFYVRHPSVEAWLAVPVDAEAEAQALTLLAADDPPTRAAGALALIPFESTAHIERLLRLAHGPGPDAAAVRRVLARWQVPLP